MSFIVKTWNNSHYHISGAGYGLKVTMQDREQFFNRDWQTVIIHLSGNPNPIEVNVAERTFWNRSCGELISEEIGWWLQRNNRATWPNRQPHQVRMTVVGERVFNADFVA